MGADVEQFHLLVGRLLTFLVDFGVELRGHSQSGFGLGRRDVVQGHLVGLERHALPVLADRAEQSMLDGVPFGGSGRIVADGHAQAMFVAQPLLQVAFEDPAAGAVCPTGVGEDEQFPGLGVVLLAVAAPPVLDGIDCKFGSLPRSAHHDHAGVAADVVDPVGQRHALGIGGEIVVVDLPALAPPGPAAIFEVADELAFFAIDADDRQICGLELPALGRNGQELPIAPGPIAPLALEAGLDVLPIGLEREVHGMQ